jgi:general secretion pathway protein K
MILLLVLATVVLFTAMVVGFSADEGFDIELAYNFRDSTQAQYIARAGIEAAVTVLREDDRSYDSADEDWGAFAENALVASAYLDGPAFTGAITDESAKIDLNAILGSDPSDRAFRTAQFRRLFTLLEIDIAAGDLDDLISALIDWLDKDSETDTGAEDDYYQSLDKPYLCKNGPMDCPEEIMLVKGMKPDYYYGTENYRGIGPYLAVNTGGRINVNTASEVVLRSLSDNLDDAVAERVIDGRPYMTTARAGPRPSASAARGRPSG